MISTYINGEAVYMPNISAGSEGNNNNLDFEIDFIESPQYGLLIGAEYPMFRNLHIRSNYYYSLSNSRDKNSVVYINNKYLSFYISYKLTK